MKRIRDLIVLLLLVGLLVASWFMHGVRRVETDSLVVALTFDDGPNPPYTDALLSVLADKKVTATFFLIGQEVEAHPETARQITKAGHELGGHSYGWESLALKRRKQVEQQLDQMCQAFLDAGIPKLVLFRPPSGILVPGQAQLLQERGLTHISADVVVGDWKLENAEAIRERVVKKVRPGSIIVLHDGGGNRGATVKATPMIIDDLRSNGYSFVSVSELLRTAP
ncbi:MAG: polysaccharide deacetylase family protein [Pontiella sp.]